MRLPLLIGARPRFCVSPRIPLGAGSWVVTSNHKDSQILIDYKLGGRAATCPLNGSPVEIDVPDNTICIIQAIVTVPGSEEHLDVYAERTK
jgi:hypothetical protein